MTQARRAFVGKHISMYDSFNGSSEYLKVDDVKKRKNGTYEFTGETAFQSKKSVYISKEIVNELMRQGVHIDKGEVEHITVTVTWKLSS